MRSAVSVILSAPAPESNMSHPDYRQTAHDHASFLILVRHLGSRLSTRTFSRLYERISRQNTFKIKDSSGNFRTIYTRYVRSYPVENNEWGDFQTHRRVLGLICVGECSNTQEVSELCRIHESLRTKYNNTLYDSRCLFLGLQHDGTPYSSCNPPTPTSNGESGDSTVNSGTGFRGTPPSPRFKYHSAPVEIPDLPSGSEELETQSMSSTILSRDSIDDSTSNCELSPNKISHPTRTLYYPSLDKCASLESDLQDFVSSLFWVLESKRLSALSTIDKERQPLLCAPFERKDLIGMDLDSRTHRKRSIGRWRKQIGDISFQAGLTAEALDHYQTAADLLRPVNDWLWLAGAYEGLCAASVVLLYPHLRRPAAIQRIGSLTGEGFGRSRVGSSGTGMRSLPVDLDPTQNFLKNRFKFKHCLGPDEILEKYHEAVVHYSKYRNAGVIETEASIKAVHVLIEQKKFLSAAEFLQNVVFINLQLSDEEKVQRFTALSELYSQLGFQRKSSFFRRVSAMRSVAPQTSMQPNWSLCYSLLLEALPGYKLSLDPTQYSIGSANGWPALQVQILQELIGTARRLANVPLAIRHAALLVHLLLIQQNQGSPPALTTAEQCELARQLEVLSQRCEVALHPGPLALDNGTIIPPVPWTLLPKIRSFKLQPTEAALKAQKLQTATSEESSGPFLFTPIQFGSFRKSNKKHQVHMDFQWVEGDHCEVAIQAYNPAPFELRITNMHLLTEDVEFETEPATLNLGPGVDGSASTVILSGIPRAHGLLKIVGYSTTVLGLKSQCKLKNVLPWLSGPFYSIEVVPALPRLQIQVMSPVNLPNAAESHGVAAASSMQLYAGQSTECYVTIVNTSNVPVETFDLELVLPNRPTCGDVFSFSVENLKAQLPLQPGSAASVTVYVYGASDFIMPTVTNGLAAFHQDDLNSLPSLSGPPSLFSRMSSQIAPAGSPGPGNRNRAKRAESLVSVRSGNSSTRSGGSSGVRVTESSQHSSTPSSKTVEALLKLQYSGGPGYAAGYCRTSTVSLSVDILPSVVITKWDVLPAETPSHCYLVLDVLNTTPHEMDLHYSSSKHIAIEALDSCRIPVPVERCPLSKLTHVYTNAAATAEQQMEEIAKICSEHLASLVELKWTLSNPPAATSPESADPKPIRGKASLTGLQCSTSMLDLLHIPPVQLDLQIDGELWSSERAEFSCTVGQVLDVSVTLLNALSISLGPLNLQVAAYQDLQNGTCHRRLDTRLLTVGSDSALLDKVEAGQQYRHCNSIAFFTPGSYKLDIICSLLTAETNESGLKAAVPAAAASPYETPNCRHVWKFVPAVEVMVKES